MNPGSTPLGAEPFAQSIAHPGTQAVVTDGEPLQEARRLQKLPRRGHSAVLQRAGTVAKPSPLRIKRGLAPSQKATPNDHPNLGPPSPETISLGLGLPFLAMSSHNRNQDPVSSPNAPFLWLEGLLQPRELCLLELRGIFFF